MDNHPAFPNTGNSTWNLHPHAGMSLRDWFAGQALVGLLASTDYDANPHGFTGDVAKVAIKIADAMLEARKPKEETTNA